MNVLTPVVDSATTSMLEDVQAHRRTEVDHITGALVREAERLGVDVPLQTAMHRLVMPERPRVFDDPIDPLDAYVFQ